ncbi:MAG: PilZ domain-containing protein [Myxococcales bacterium]|nr:PilZ domain-containing protein [Myxococcales bacterium]MCB9523463.1 PilZ domain-containing protein [Myxococcales bacterium]
MQPQTALPQTDLDRRVHTRAPCRVDVREVQGAQIIEGRATNISEGGLYLQRLDDRDLVVGETLTMDIALPLYGVVRATGVVVKPAGDVFYRSAAVRFVELCPLAALRIRRFVYDRGRRPVRGMPIGRISLERAA